MSENEVWEDKVLKQATGRFDSWMSCDDCFDHSDVAIDVLADYRGKLPEDFLAHLRGCPVCLEEVDALAAMAAIERGQDPQEIHDALFSQLQAS